MPEPADLELLKELVGPTGAWRSWSSQFRTRPVSDMQVFLSRSFELTRLHHHDPGLAHALGAFIQ